MAKIVIALGGNALGHTVETQKTAIKRVAPVLVDLIEQGNQLVITHGNGPQVGMIHLAFSHYFASQETQEVMPFPECTAMSEGYIGYHLQHALTNECRKRDLKQSVCTCVTQVLVDKEDPAFQAPTKPIGPFYSKEEADALASTQGYVMKEDAGRGYRRMVASPLPRDIVEKETIGALMGAGQVVIACGGGGVPVYQHNRQLTGIDAVVDKDFASAKLAELIQAEQLIILTAVDQVYIHFNQENQQALTAITPAEMEQLIAEQQFGEGSMLPKVQAAVQFAAFAKGNHAIITSIDAVKEALEGANGTIISEREEA